MEFFMLYVSFAAMILAIPIAVLVIVEAIQDFKTWSNKRAK